MGDNTLPLVPSVDDMLGAIEAKKQQIASDETLARELREGRPSGNPIQLGPRLPDPAKWAAMQIQGAQNNASKWLENTVHPKKNFKEEGLKEKSKRRYHDSMNRVLAENSWEGGMELVNESEALATVQKRGAGSYSSGVADRQAKIERVVKDLHGDRLALAATVDDLPNSTDAEREAKMIANKRGLQAIGRKRRGA